MKRRITISLRKIFSLAASAIARKYLQKDRVFTYKGLRLQVWKDVFHPGLFRSTKVFAEWLSRQDVAGKNIVEIGSGSGLISLVAARNGATVTAVDVNPKAVDNTSANAKANGLTISVIHSDLLTDLPHQPVDVVLVNPPYYPKDPQNDYEKAWYCGESFEYFEKLFQQLSKRGLADRSYMILSDTCDLIAITSIAGKFHIRLDEMHTKTIAGERLIIYQTCTC